MRIRTMLGGVIVVQMLLSVSFGAVPTIITHEGRLLRADGTPESGSKSMTFSLYNTPTGGVALASETQMVNVDDGLFAVQLSAFGDNMLYDHPQCYLGIQVESDAELLPRMLISTVPYARISSSVDGDVETAPGSLRVGYPFDPDIRERVAKTLAGSSGTSIELMDSSKVDHSSARSSWTTSNPGIGSVSGGALTMEVDDDGDGVPESELIDEVTANAVNREVKRMGGKIAMRLDSSGSSLELLDSSSSTGARYRAGVRVINGTKAVTSVEQYSDIDEDGDGHSEAKTNIAALLNGNTVIGCATDADDDGVPEAETELSTSSSGVAHRFVWNSAADLGSEPNLKWNINLNPTGQDVTGLMSSDVDGDGTPEMKYGTILAGLSQLAETRMETDTDDNGTPDVGISSKTTMDSAVLSSFFERGDKPTQSQFANLLDSDGITSTFDSHNGSTTGTIRMMASPDSVDEISTIGDGSSSSTSSMRLRLNELEAKLQNIGILARTTVTQACDDTSASISIKRNDGPDTPIAMEIQDLTTSPLRVSHRLALDGDVDGIADKQILLDCDDDDAGLAILAGVAIPKFIDITARDAGTLPGSTSDVSLVMGMGVDSLLEFRGDDSETSLSLSSVSDNSRIYIIDDNTGVSMSVTPPTSGTYQFEVTVTDATGLVRLRDAAGNVSLDLDADGRLGVGGAAHATNPIHHSSGAHLTVGGDWTNASDKDLKENFTKIDGKELLEKIEELPISQWNYKNEDESVVHIGPSAQDFQKTFGVGSNDKSISTIDPSGIALAAIKELNKQNRDLTKQNDELKKELESLKKKVDELISRK